MESNFEKCFWWILSQFRLPGVMGFLALAAASFFLARNAANRGILVLVWSAGASASEIWRNKCDEKIKDQKFMTSGQQTW